MSVDKPPSGRDPVDAAARDELRQLFELETVHRRGPASLVCLARDLEFDQPVALKLMPRAPGAGAEAEEAFHRAAALVAALDHPHIVPLYSAGATDRFFWCSMEYIEGRSLAEALRSSAPMEPSASLRLVAQVATALDAAHRLGVVHAGLTPANVLIDAAGDAHVGDFWIPWVLERLGALPGDGGKARRAKYRAPEQLSEETCGPEADQHALAALMQACLIKTPARIPPDVGRAIDRALNPTPEARFPSVRNFVQALGAAGAQAPRVEAPRVEPPRVEPPRVGPPRVEPPRLLGLDPKDYPPDAPRPSRWRWVTAGVVTLVALGAVAAPWLLSSASRRDRDLGLDDGYVPPPVDSFAVAVPAAVSFDTAAVVGALPPRPSPPVAAPARRPSVVSRPPARVRPLPSSAAPAPAAPAPGRLFINATPWGQVYIDGELIGNTPRVDVPVSPGSHRLRVVQEGFEPYEVGIRVGSGRELRITDIVLQQVKP
jgi:protein kinase-like protein/PEGA domain-containing protein